MKNIRVKPYEESSQNKSKQPDVNNNMVVDDVDVENGGISGASANREVVSTRMSPSSQQLPGPVLHNGDNDDESVQKEMEKPVLSIRSFAKSGLCSIRVIIVFIFISGLLLTGIVSWFLTYDSSQKSISIISKSLQSEIESNIANQINQKINNAYEIVLSHKILMKRGIIDPRSEIGFNTMMEKFFVVTLTSKDVTSCWWTSTRGELIGHLRNPEGSKLGMWIAHNRTTIEYEVNENRDIVGTNWIDNNMDSTTAAWYTVVDRKKPDELVWTPTYTWANRLWSTLTTCAFTPDGEFIGAVGSDMEFGFVTELLESLSKTRNTNAIVVNNEGIIIGSSLGLPIQTCSPEEGKCASGPAPVSFEDINDEFAISVNNYVRVHFSKWDSFPESAVKTKLEIKGKTYLVSFSKIKAHSIGWNLVLLVPEDDYMGRIKESNKNTIILVFCLIGSFSLIIFLFALYITRPLNQIAKAMYGISRLEFQENGSAAKKSSLKEIQMMQSSFQIMDTALRSFGKFVPTSVVERIVLNTKGASDLYVENRLVTIMFTDIRDFTQTAESLEVGKLISIMSDYLEEMSAIIMSCGGTVSDFIGDGILAFWNAPLDIKDHAYVACRSALLQQKALISLNKKWISNGLLTKPFFLRIGIHTGRVLAGNIGSTRRMKYGAVGDAVNLASRIEGLNKRYESQILMSRDTANLIVGSILYRTLEKVVVKGRSHITEICEVMGDIKEPVESSDQEFDPQSAKEGVALFSEYHDPHGDDTHREIALSKLVEYSKAHPLDIVAARTLDIYQLPNYTGISVLDTK